MLILKSFKTTIAYISLFALASLTASAHVSAQNITDPLNGRFGGLNDMLAVAMQVVFWLGMGLSAAFIAMAGLKMMGSGGDPKNIQAAQKQLTWAVVGFIVVIGAGAIMHIVARMMGAGDFSLLPGF